MCAQDEIEDGPHLSFVEQDLGLDSVVCIEGPVEDFEQGTGLIWLLFVKAQNRLLCRNRCGEAAQWH